ncbi:MAG TPA: hypothetical protein DHM44_02225 [Flexistipes sinusarabici]|uniref:Uncharacterized protein n=1 Tax=Flexistipes sinusarabici TaxID=2352 RepID=A0A3D5Q9G6_FLESI|nr:hypothetical protein [Flexistipes sinusarabici]
MKKTDKKVKNFFIKSSCKICLNKNKLNLNFALLAIIYRYEKFCKVSIYLLRFNNCVQFFWFFGYERGVELIIK